MQPSDHREARGTAAHGWIPVCFFLAACFWVPHWWSHYRQFGTQRVFGRRPWDFMPGDSWGALVVYGLLIIANLSSVWAPSWRWASAVASGVLAMSLGSLQFYRLWKPFPFEIFGYSWSREGSVLEAMAVTAFGAAFFVVAHRVRPVSSP